MQQKKFRECTVSFEQMVKDLCTFPAHENAHEPLVFLSYDEEIRLKNSALSSFLNKSGIVLKPLPVIASPKPRNYRTTTKRRVFLGPNGVGLGFSKPVKAGMVARSALEPQEHQTIYQWLQKTLSEKTFSPLARVLNWVIIRGSYQRHFLILNIFDINSGVVRKLKTLSTLMKKELAIDGAISYFDPTRSEYYLEAENPPNGLQIKHLFGSKLLGLKVNDIMLLYPPTVFSQVNESMVPVMVDLAKSLLDPKPGDQMLDLYCGYGLFSHTVGKYCKNVTAVEVNQDSIDSARRISRRLKTETRMRFFTGKINASLVKNKFDLPKKRELILLDPPRKGCDTGVISNIAKRNPKRVLHIFCGTDEIPRELRQWQNAGYSPEVIQPIDMFAGTPNLETMILLERTS